ncbi:ATP-binding cassette domain-containing protein, partial [bacterium 1XD42-8]
MYNNNVIKIENLGKMYKLYKNPKDKIMDAFGLNFWKKDYYKEFWALRGINIQIKRGERVGLIGHNGAGKSTMLKIIIGNIQPSEGSIKIE